MSVNESTTVEPDDTNAWHALPVILGRAIGADGAGHNACGNYHAIREEDDRVILYRVINRAESVEGLETEGDRMWELGDCVEGLGHIATLEPPADGWESEVEHVPASVWGGFR